MVATPRRTRSAEGGVWALMSKSSHCGSLVGPPQVVWGFGRAWESREGQHCEGAGCLDFLGCAILTPLCIQDEEGFQIPVGN